MSRISRNISVVLRTERLIAQRNLAIVVKRSGIFAAAGLAAGLAVIMLNVAGFLALSEMMSKPLAALTVAGVDLIIAMILALLANSLSAQEDTAQVAELRDIAIADIEAEIQDTLSEARATMNGLRNVGRDPLSMIAPGLASAVVNALIKHLKSQKDKRE